jgi:hypothetical protein
VRREDVVDRLSELLPREPPSPEEKARRSAVKQAKQQLRDARKAHSARVKECRKILAEAQREHKRGVRAAERALEEARRLDEDVIREAEAKRRLAGERELLASWGPLVLYDDRVEAPEGVAALARDTRAVVDIAENLVVRERAMARLAGEAPLAVLRRLEGRGGRGRSRLFIALETNRFVSVVPCDKGDPDEVREFARRVNVAALNVEELAQGRAEAIALAERALSRLTARRAAAVDEAERVLAAAEDDTTAIDAAQRALAAAEADTDEVERREAALRAIEADSAQS